VLRKRSLAFRLGILVVGMVLPLTIFATLLLYYNFEANRRANYNGILQIARGLISNVDAEFRSAVASLQVLALSPTLQSGNLEVFRQQAEQFLSTYFPLSNVVVSDATGQQLINTALPHGAPLPRYIRMEVLRRVFETGNAQISNLLVGPVLQRNIVVVDVPVRRDNAVIYDLAASLPLTSFTDVIMRLRPEADWTIAIFDGSGRVVARSSDAERFIGRTAAPALHTALMSEFEGTLETVTFDGTLVLTAFSRSPYSGWASAIGIPKSVLTSQLWHSVAILIGVGILCLGLGTLLALRLATQLLRAETNRELLIHELNHRVKNTLATLQGIVASTLRTNLSAQEARKAIDERIMAFARAHDILAEERWENVDLRDLLNRVVDAYRTGQQDRIELLGPALKITPRAAVTLAMVVNEMTTNAVKYGALSSMQGQVRLEWRTLPTEHPKLEICWTESEGPAVDEPTRRGFGSILIEQSVVHELAGTVQKNFASRGLVCTITIPLDRLLA
jgi:two-component sensor histidine kinase